MQEKESQTKFGSQHSIRYYLSNKVNAHPASSSAQYAPPFQSLLELLHLQGVVPLIPTQYNLRVKIVKQHEMYKVKGII